MAIEEIAFEAGGLLLTPEQPKALRGGAPPTPPVVVLPKVLVASAAPGRERGLTPPAKPWT